MKLFCQMLLSFLLITCGFSQNKYEELFSYAISQYPVLNDIEWEINYSNSVEWNSEHYDIEGIGKKKDTTCLITFAIFPNRKDTFANIIEYGELYNDNNWQYYTSYDSAFVPIYKYKQLENNQDSVVFIFGRDAYFNGEGF